MGIKPHLWRACNSSRLGRYTKISTESVKTGLNRVYKSVVIELAIDAQHYAAYYRGTAREVIARAADGRHIRFPANILQTVITREGIHGMFELRYDKNNRFVDIRRL